ncbi:hypothetical protein [Nocardia nova]
MNRRQAKYAARKAAAAEWLAAEIAEAWDQAHAYNAWFDQRAAADAGYDPTAEPPTFDSIEDFFAQFDDDDDTATDGEIVAALAGTADMVAFDPTDRAAMLDLI